MPELRRNLNLLLIIFSVWVISPESGFICLWGGWRLLSLPLRHWVMPGWRPAFLTAPARQS